MRGWNVLRLPPEMVKLLTFVLIIGGVQSVGGASSRFSLMFFRGAFVQVDPSQERVAQRILGGFCAGDGDPGGKSGRKTPPAWLDHPGHIRWNQHFLTHVSTGSRCPAGSEQDRCSDPNDGERQSR